MNKASQTIKRLPVLDLTCRSQAHHDKRDSHMKINPSVLFFLINLLFLAARGLSLVAASGSYSSLRCVEFSLQWLLLLRSTGSRRAGFSSCGSRALERRPISCGARA